MWKFAARNLLSRKVRTLLALLGLTVAILAMVGLFSVAEGLDASFDDAFGRIPGLVAMQPGAPVPLFSSLPTSWGDEIETMRGVRSVNPEVWQRANLIEGKMITKKPRFLFGVDIPTRLELEHAVYRDAMLPGEGRYLELDDVGTTNVVVSRPVADDYKVGVGDRLNVNGVELEIVGIYHTKSLLLDVAILMDIDLVRRMTGFNPEMVSSYYIEQDGSVPDDELTKSIEERFRGRSIPAPTFGRSTLSRFVDGIVQFLEASPTRASVPPVPAEPEPDGLPIEVKSANDWGEQVDEFSGDLDVFLFLLTSIGVTIAVLSILNTMLMSVSERIVEFGVLRANGWSPRDVMTLVTLESSYIGLAGGLLGCLGGWAGTLLVNQAFSDRIQLYASPSLLLFSLAFSVVIGVLGGLYPAYWAMRMSPMEAIRR